MGGNPTCLFLVLVEGIVAERVVVGRAPSCHPVQVEHQKDSACHRRVDPSQPSEERWDQLD